MVFSDLNIETRRHLEECYEDAHYALFLYSMLTSTSFRPDLDSPYGYSHTLQLIGELSKVGLINIHEDVLSLYRNMSGDIPGLQLKPNEEKLKTKIKKEIQKQNLNEPQCYDQDRQLTRLTNYLCDLKTTGNTLPDYCCISDIKCLNLTKINPYLVLIELALKDYVQGLVFHFSHKRIDQNTETLNLEPFDPNHQYAKFSINWDSMTRKYSVKDVGDFCITHEGTTISLTYKQKPVSNLIKSQDVKSIRNAVIILALLLEQEGKPVSMSKIAEAMEINQHIENNSLQKKAIQQNISGLRRTFIEALTISNCKDDSYTLSLVS